MSKEKKSIFRVSKKQTNYTIIDNTAIHDPRLSWKAKGLIAYMLTMPDDWEFYRDELSKHAADGISALRSGMTELKKYGYLKRVAVRDPDTKKIVRWDTLVFENPQNSQSNDEESDENPLVENQPIGDITLLAEKPPVENLQVENLQVGNRTLLSTNFIQSTNNTHLKDVATREVGKIPDIMKPIVLYFQETFNKPQLTDDDCLCFRLLEKIHTPATVQKQIDETKKRFTRIGKVKYKTAAGEEIEITILEDMAVRYIYNSMQNWSSKRKGDQQHAQSKAGRGAATRENRNYASGENGWIFGQ